MEHIFDKFTTLQDSLLPVIKLWDDLLSTINEDIHGIKDKNEKMAVLISYNIFQDILSEMRFICDTSNTSHEIKKNARTIADIKLLLDNDFVGDHIGMDIEEKLLTPVELIMNGSDQNKWWKRIKCIFYLKKAISLLQKGNKVIPVKFQASIIERINSNIIKLNKYKYGNFGKGILLHVAKTPFNNIRLDIAMIFPLKCADCNHYIEVHSNQYENVFAPLKCPFCNKKRIVRCNYFRNHMFLI